MGTYVIAPIVKGDTLKAKIFEVKINGVAMNLTLASINIVFKLRDDRGVTVKSATLGNGITMIDAAAGKFRLDQFNVEFEKGRYFHKCILVDSGITRTLYTGEMIVE